MSRCCVFGCVGKYHARGYCARHYQQMLKHGRILERTIYDPNDFIFDGNYCWIILRDRECAVIGKALIDREDYFRVKEYKWRLQQDKGRKYATSGGGSKGRQSLLWLHKHLLNEKGEIDHKNNNGLDNRKSNLRKCTHSENGCNQKINMKNTSGFKGVTFFKSAQSWGVRIGYQGKRIYLGLVETAEEGALLYNTAAKDLHGEFARLNKLPGST